MRFRLAAALLVTVLASINVLSAPAPDPFAILDIGLPPKGKTAEEHRKYETDRLSHPRPRGLFLLARNDPEVRKLPSIRLAKDPCEWLAQNLRVTPEAERKRLRLTFRAGSRAEQAAILNALLRTYVHWEKDRIDFLKRGLKVHEDCCRDLEKRIESEKDARMIAKYREGINDLRSTRMPATRAEIARLKEIAVIQWAK